VEECQGTATGFVDLLYERRKSVAGRILGETLVPYRDRWVAS
jgi:hypothetical protein